MANIPSSGQYLNDTEISGDAPLTEALFEKTGGSINYLLDQNTARVSDISTLSSQLGGKISEIHTSPLTAVNNTGSSVQTNAIASFVGLGKTASIYWLGGRFSTVSNGQVGISVNGSQVALLLSNTSGGINGGVYEYASTAWRIINGLTSPGSQQFFGGAVEPTNLPSGYTVQPNFVYYTASGPTPVPPTTVQVIGDGILVYRFFAVLDTGYTIQITNANFSGTGGTATDRAVFRITY